MKTPNPTPETPTRSECFKALACLYLATDQRVADDLNAKVRSYIFDLERALAEAKREVGKVNDFRERLRAKHRQVCDERDQLSSLAHQLKAEIERLKAERQWQPIASAPRDGTMILGFSPDWLDDDYNPSGIRLCFYDGDDKWRSAFWENTGDCFDTDDVNGPTLWMPLPAARTTQEGQG